MLKPEYFSSIACIDNKDPTAEFYLIRDMETLLPVCLTWANNVPVCRFQNRTLLGFCQRTTLEETRELIRASWTHVAFVYLATNGRLEEFRKQIVGNYYMVDVLPLRK